MKQIKLSQNKYTLIDDDDFKRVNQFKWCVWRTAHKTYVGRKEMGKTLYLHRFIMDPPFNKQIDHKDGNGFNNCKNNLRICTNAENTRNRPVQKNNKCGVKGVSWRNDKKRWSVNIKVDGHHKSGGYFNNLEEAGMRYKELAEKYFGEFARV